MSPLSLTRRSTIAGLFLAPALTSLAIRPVQSAVSGSQQVVERLHENLLATMKSATVLGLKGRYEKLQPEIVRAFDHGRMIQAAVGTDWQKATTDQRSNLIDAFTRISVGTYARRFDGYSGESFKTLGERPGPNGLILVDTQIVRPDAPPVGLVYVTRSESEQWRIIDVLLDSSVSELAVRRSEYRRVIQSEGVDGLIAVLRKKADELIAS